ncbi:MAG: chemotaxis-specific protein-glutamate methyltransferase CheB [[Eubacterium] siraeum]|nr:chemotaxis-specific protein-glutamate methyltransferase CheB [[Eubacterium] siraeum]
MTPTTKIKVLLVDDSTMYRTLMNKGLSTRTNIEIVGEAADAFEARDKITELKPDVLVMDIEMPKMDGITFLRQLMGQYPLPCIMVSSTDGERDAIAAGAAAFIQKPKSPADQSRFITMLGTKISVAATKKVSFPPPGGSSSVKIDGVAPINDISAKIGRIPPNLPTRDEMAGLTKRSRDQFIVALGASTGGTDALECVLKSFPDTMPPVLVVQHMPPVFTRLYSERMNKCCSLNVKEAADGDRLSQGTCLIAAGGFQMELKKDAKGYYVKCYQGEKVSGHCPSVDVMFNSVAEVAGKKSIGALMTGMGADGAKGLLNMHNKGAHTIGQDKESCIVYGMPMEAYKLGACSEQQSLCNIGKTICKRLTDGW